MGKKMNKEKKDDILYTVLTLLLGVAMIAAGLFGVVSSRIESKEYKNSADIHEVSAVIYSISTHEDKDDNNDVKNKTYKFKVKFDVDGKTYKGEVEKRYYPRELTDKYKKIEIGDNIDVEIYKTSKGSYKISPEGNPAYFMLYCFAIPVGALIVVGMSIDLKKKKSKKDNGDSGTTDK